MTSTCGAKQTNSLPPANKVNALVDDYVIFSSGLHMHQHGRQIYTEQFRYVWHASNCHFDTHTDQSTQRQPEDWRCWLQWLLWLPASEVYTSQCDSQARWPVHHALYLEHYRLGPECQRLRVYLVRNVPQLYCLLPTNPWWYVSIVFLAIRITHLACIGGGSCVGKPTTVDNPVRRQNCPAN